MKNFELHLMYKSETSFAHKPIECTAYMARKTFDIIIDSDDLDPRILDQFTEYDKEQEVQISFPDPNYETWLENKIIELLGEINEARLLHDYKSDYEDAKYEIGQLENELDQIRYQLQDAEDEIKDLNRKQ